MEPKGGRVEVIADHARHPAVGQATHQRGRGAQVALTRIAKLGFNSPDLVDLHARGELHKAQRVNPDLQDQPAVDVLILGAVVLEGIGLLDKGSWITSPSVPAWTIWRIAQ